MQIHSKIIACITMLIDHLGFLVFPNVVIIRIIGKLHIRYFPFLVAEGCFYTKNRFKHFYVITLLAIVFQFVYYLFLKSFDLSIFIIFSISILLIYLFDYIVIIYKNKKYILGLLTIIVFISIILLVYYIDNQYYYLEYSYGFFGVIIPVVIYIFRKYLTNNMIILFIVLTSLLIFNVLYTSNYPNLFMCGGALLMLLYNGKKGHLNLKYYFYLFYPAHIALVYLLYLII